MNALTGRATLGPPVGGECLKPRPCDYNGHVPAPVTYQAERQCRICLTRQLVTVSYAPHDPWRISYKCLACRGRWTIDGTP